MLISLLNLSLRLVKFKKLESPEIKIYTDGSCHAQLLVGAWAAIIFSGEQKIILKGIETGTTHNRMELLAVINAIDHCVSKGYANKILTIYSDSQYVVNLCSRKEKLQAKNFITNKGTPIQNNDLVQTLLKQMTNYQLKFTKVKAHEKPDGTQNFNREVDLVVRKLVRETVLQND